MPPSRKSSSSSRSSRRSSSKRRSSSCSSRSSSNSSYSSSTERSRRKASSAASRHRTFESKPKHIPKSIQKNSSYIHATEKDYIFCPSSWGYKGNTYQKGYYDNKGNYYSSNSVSFKQTDGSYIAHYECEYCQTEAKITWKEGYQPVCKNCGAQMCTATYTDDVISIQDYSRVKAQDKSRRLLAVIIAFLFIPTIPMLLLLLLIVILSFFEPTLTIHEPENLPIIYDNHTNSKLEEIPDSYDGNANIEKFGSNIYLEETEEKAYIICTMANMKNSAYDKHLWWNDELECYCDSDSNCYVWYNTDVFPNVWQYWYDDIAGNNYYGWMEYYDGEWFIEISDTDWEKYTGDTSELWHIIEK